MNRILRISLLVCLFTSFFSLNNIVKAQSSKTEYQFNLLAGYSFTSVKLLGKTSESQTQFLSIGYQRRVYKYFPGYSFWYTADIIPRVHYFYPKRDERGKFVNRTGFGFSPIGFLFTLKKSSFILPYVKTSGGFIYMNDEFPTDRARRLNFTFDIATGVNLNITSFLTVSFGYKFHHISNAETGSENPGLDSNIFFLKLTIQ